jgi:hypothetical protein
MAFPKHFHRSKTMADKFRAGEAQEWNSHGNMGRGKVKRKLTTRTLIKGHAVAAPEELDGAGDADGWRGEHEGQPGADPAEPANG